MKTKLISLILITILVIPIIFTACENPDNTNFGATGAKEWTPAEKQPNKGQGTPVIELNKGLKQPDQKLSRKAPDEITDKLDLKSPPEILFKKALKAIAEKFGRSKSPLKGLEQGFFKSVS